MHRSVFDINFNSLYRVQSSIRQVLESGPVLFTTSLFKLPQWNWKLYKFILTWFFWVFVKFLPPLKLPHWARSREDNRKTWVFKSANLSNSFVSWENFSHLMRFSWKACLQNNFIQFSLLILLQVLKCWLLTISNF